jgi:hypothetical protein
MAAKLLDDLIRTGFNHQEPFLVINGRPGVGKSTLLANLPDHLIFNYDLGLGELNARSIDMSEQTFEDQLSLLEQVSQRQGDIKWVCFDSADKMEVKIQESVCRDHGWSSIEEPGYGKGYMYAREKNAKFLRYNKRLQQKGFGIAISCHAAIRSLNEPHLGESYDLYTSKLHKHIAADLYEAADAILFATIKTSVQKKTGDFGKKTTQNVVSGERILYTQPMTGVEAKNRFNLPAEIPLDAEALLNLITENRNQ